jgi:hypothetical protein
MVADVGIERFKLPDLGTLIYRELTVEYGTSKLKGIEPFFKQLSEAFGNPTLCVYSIDDLVKLKEGEHEKMFESWKIRGLPVREHRGIRAYTDALNPETNKDSLVVFGPYLKDSSLPNFIISHISRPFVVRDLQDRVALRVLKEKLSDEATNKPESISTDVRVHHVGNPEVVEDNNEIYSHNLMDYGGSKVVFIAEKLINVPLEEVDFSGHIYDLKIMPRAINAFTNYQSERKQEIGTAVEKIFNTAFVKPK